jgi:hypothetical protein
VEIAAIPRGTVAKRDAEIGGILRDGAGGGEVDVDGVVGDEGGTDVGPVGMGPGRQEGVASEMPTVSRGLLPPLQQRRPEGSRRPRSRAVCCSRSVYAKVMVTRSVPAGTRNGTLT